MTGKSGLSPDSMMFEIISISRIRGGFLKDIAKKWFPCNVARDIFRRLCKFPRLVFNPDCIHEDSFHSIFCLSFLDKITSAFCNTCIILVSFFVL